MVHHCPRCELRFVTEVELKEHLGLDHGTPTETLERYRYPAGAGAQAPLYRDLAEEPDGPRRYLLVANQSLGGPQLADRLRALVAAGPAVFYVVVPATPPRDYPAEPGGPEPQAHAAQARWRLRRTIDWLRTLGVEAGGEVGPPDPLEAVGLALARAPADEVVVSTLPSHQSRWLGADVPGLIARRFRLPVTTIVPDRDRAAGHR